MLSPYVLVLGGAFGAVLPISRSNLGHNTIEVPIPGSFPVSLAVNLNSPDSVLFDRRHCPIYINCHDTGVSNGTYSMSLLLGTLDISDFEFQVGDNDGYISDVGGVLGMSPRGRIARESRILFHSAASGPTNARSDDSFDFVPNESPELFVSFQNHSSIYDEDFVSFRLDDNLTTSWTVSGVRMSIGDASLNTFGMLVELDVFSPYMTFPESMRFVVLGAIRKIFGHSSINAATSTVNAPCGPDSPTEIFLTLNNGNHGHVDIPIRLTDKPSFFDYDYSDYETTSMCPTVINFGLTNTIIMGSPLLKNRSGIALDSVTKQLIVNTGGAAFQPPSILPISSSPTPPVYEINSVEMKEIWNGENFELRIIFDKTDPTDPCAYYPVTYRPVPVTHAHIPGTLAYVFDRANRGPSSCGSDRDLPVFVHLLNKGYLEYDLAKNTVAIPFEFVSTIDRQTYRGEIVHERFRMYLFLTPIEVEVNYKDLYLGEFSEQQDHEELTECVICNNRIVPGEYKQGLRGCSHVFHDDCLERKFSKDRRYGCPTCGKFTGFERGAFIMERHPQEDELWDSSADSH